MNMSKYILLLASNVKTICDKFNIPTTIDLDKIKEKAECEE